MGGGAFVGERFQASYASDMSQSPARRTASFEDLLDVPEHLVAEIVDGELVTSPRPSSRHARASSRLGVSLGGPFDMGSGGPGGWVILDEPELHIVGQVLVPDLAGWRRERMPEVPDVAHFELAPDWVCEVLSPGTAKRDRTRKMHHYARAGVAFLWFLDPSLRVLETYRRESDGWKHLASFADTERPRPVPFDAIELDLGALWSP
jgi:Uma2 family endonuclease